MSKSLRPEKPPEWLPPACVNIVHGYEQVAYRVQRRRNVQIRAFLRWFKVFMAVTGGMSGILLGVIILNWISPGHPVYMAVRAFLQGVLIGL